MRSPILNTAKLPVPDKVAPENVASASTRRFDNPTSRVVPLLLSRLDGRLRKNDFVSLLP